MSVTRGRSARRMRKRCWGKRPLKACEGGGAGNRMHEHSLGGPRGGKASGACMRKGPAPPCPSSPLPTNCAPSLL
eukprot:scaffold24623_cov68-Isochrysis_galbana.AAC.1